MPAPSQDTINTNVQSWIDTDIGIDAIAEDTASFNQISDTIAQLESDIGAAADASGSGDAIDVWRETLRAVPLEANDAAIAQLDAAVPTLKSTIAALYT